MGLLWLLLFSSSSASSQLFPQIVVFLCLNFIFFVTLFNTVYNAVQILRPNVETLRTHLVVDEDLSAIKQCYRCWPPEFCCYLWGKVYLWTTCGMACPLFYCREKVPACVVYAWRHFCPVQQHTGLSCYSFPIISPLPRTNKNSRLTKKLENVELKIRFTV